MKEENEIDVTKGKHELIEVKERTLKNRKKRSRCLGCYQEIRKKQGREKAQNVARKVSTKCNICNVSLCLTCFARKH